jgi:NADPH-dependent 2,4-dienoyl-CoA reductase/sulfur reductase-like enzyme
VGQQRVIIIGSGPAGTRCAEALVAAGLRPTVIDENGNNGGQAYRRQPQNFARGYGQLYGSEAEKAAAIHADFDALRDDIDFRPNTLAWAVSDNVLYTVEDGRSVEVPFDALVLCTGASERIMPTLGWHYAGNYSLGGAQIALKAQGCAIGSNVVFMGTGPLLYLVASQYIKAGANVAAVLDTSTIWDSVAALPSLLAKPSMLFTGLGLVKSIRAANVPIVRGIQPIEISGSGEAGVDGIKYRDARGRVQTRACDAVALGYHLRSETQLADLAGCEFTFDRRTRQWTTDTDDKSRSAANIYMAGDGARIRGADAAEVGGRLTALTLLADLGQGVDEKEIKRLRREYARFERFANGLTRAFPWPVAHVNKLSDDATVCRCESITVGELRAVSRGKNADEINRAKAFSRVGMGRCQGRFCGIAAAEIVADAAGIPVERVGRMRGQAPVKPLSIAVEPDKK